MKNTLFNSNKEKIFLKELSDAIHEAHNSRTSKPSYPKMAMLARWGSLEGIETIASICNLGASVIPCLGDNFVYLHKEARQALKECQLPLARFYSGIIERSIAEVCFAVAQEPDLKRRLESFIRWEKTLDADESPSILFHAADIAREALAIIKDPRQLDAVLCKRKQKYEEQFQHHQEAIRKYRSNPLLCSQCSMPVGFWRVLFGARTHKRCVREKHILCGTGPQVTELFRVNHGRQLFHIYCSVVNKENGYSSFTIDIYDDQNQDQRMALLFSRGDFGTLLFFQGSNLLMLSPGLYRLDVVAAAGPWTVEYLDIGKGIKY